MSNIDQLSIVVEVSGGMVRAVYCNAKDKAPRVEVVDLDTTDPEERDSFDKRLAEVRRGYLAIY